MESHANIIQTEGSHITHFTKATHSDAFTLTESFDCTLISHWICKPGSYPVIES